MLDHRLMTLQSHTQGSLVTYCQLVPCVLLRVLVWQHLYLCLQHLAPVLEPLVGLQGNHILPAND